MTMDESRTQNIELARNLFAALKNGDKSPEHG